MINLPTSNFTLLVSEISTLPSTKATKPSAAFFFSTSSGQINCKRFGLLQQIEYHGIVLSRIFLLFLLDSFDFFLLLLRRFTGIKRKFAYSILRIEPRNLKVARNSRLNIIIEDTWTVDFIIITRHEF